MVVVAALPILAALKGDWVDTNVVRLAQVDGASEVFDIPVGSDRFRRVITIDTSRAEHSSVQELLQSNCPRWYPLTAGEDTSLNAYSCNYNASGADSLVDAFMREHSAVLKAAHQVQSCRQRTVIPPQPPRVYVTALSTEMVPDAWCAAC